MPGSLTNRVHIPLSQYTIAQLHAKASQLREMAATARTAGDFEGLQRLSARFEELADRREVEICEACGTADVAAFRTTELDTPLGMPSPEALRMATKAMCKHYIMPETKNHPVVRSECMRLAYTLYAYGLVPTNPECAVTQTAMRTTLFVKEKRQGEPRHTTHRLLVVDDVSDVLVTVGAFLGNVGFAVRKAANGDEALRMIAGDPDIDVLVTDFAMPGLSGADLIAQAVQVRPKLKSLVITGYPNAEGLAELPPNTTILAKPFRRDALIAGVKSLLGELQVVQTAPAESVDGELVSTTRTRGAERVITIASRVPECR
jgi:CheY-like chemotaxis protein